MNKLDEIIKMNLKVTWQLMKIGYLGYQYILPQLNRKDISDYACTYLKFANNNLVEIAELIDEKSNEYDIRETLDKLAVNENSNIELQVRKWIVYLTQKMIKELGDNHIEGLLEITEFWISLGQPSISPHIFQGVENNITVQEYYTEQMYNVIIDKHIKWIEQEIEIITQLEL